MGICRRAVDKTLIFNSKDKSRRITQHIKSNEKSSRTNRCDQRLPIELLIRGDQHVQSRDLKDRRVWIKLYVYQPIPRVVTEDVKADIRMSVGPGEQGNVSLRRDLIELCQIRIR